MNQGYIAPRSQTEHTLSKIWGDVLGIPRVSVEDNFFNIGGNSLSAIRVMARIEQEFEITVPVRRIFEFSRLSDLATQVDFERFYQKPNSGIRDNDGEMDSFHL